MACAPGATTTTVRPTSIPGDTRGRACRKCHRVKARFVWNWSLCGRCYHFRYINNLLAEPLVPDPLPDDAPPNDPDAIRCVRCCAPRPTVIRQGSTTAWRVWCQMCWRCYLAARKAGDIDHLKIQTNSKSAEMVPTDTDTDSEEDRAFFAAEERLRQEYRDDIAKGGGYRRPQGSTLKPVTPVECSRPGRTNTTHTKGVAFCYDDGICKPCANSIPAKLPKVELCGRRA